MDSWQGDPELPDPDRNSRIRTETPDASSKGAASSLADELLETMKEKRSLGRHMLHLLLKRDTQSLLMGYGVGEPYYALGFLRQRCQMLKHLDLSYQSHLTPKIFVDTLKCLPRLQILNLQHTPSGDQSLHNSHIITKHSSVRSHSEETVQVMEVIGEYCPHIRDLNMTSTAISDRGVWKLCESSTGEPRSQDLVRFKVTETRVTAEGIAFLLLQCPALVDVDFPDMIQVRRTPTRLGNFRL
ncbi:unnamed protein product [Darwinula stevensoni]|uniref:Uncharacterized protein n=1 Tax=Darwinula stevensoni TaxID=69355 RepID=A0A7R8XA55_9CRUS|nr:unnamed protein product [Darwinula stevensoni]CAG0891671.1 unnamed protein product [Darwinula stevensoni]